MFSRKNIFCFIFVFLIIFTRFFNLDWGNGFFFHPDENNMAFTVSRLAFNDLNPHFFAYGQFPLYLTFFSIKFLFLPNSFSNSIFVLRFWSAIFSCFSIWFFYLIGKEIFKKNIFVLLFVLLLIFNPGLIQLAHFGTTESLLIFVFSVNLFLSLKIYQEIKFKYIFYASLISGIGLATKITAIFFTVPIFFCLFIRFLKSKNFSLFLFAIYYMIVTFFFALIFSPFNLLAFSEFKSSMQYETSVAFGTLKVFYTSQFLNTTPYVFQFQKIFPYVCGIPVFIFGILGFIVFILNTKYHIQNTKKFQQYLLILISTFIYFLYNGQLYTKWTRFMSPLFFIFPFFATYFFTKIKNKKIIYFFVFISLIPGILFLNIYFHKDIRINASEWMNENIKTDSIILSEAGNVVGLPLFNYQNFKVTDFDFYNLDNNPKLTDELPNLIKNSDYIIIPSRRIFKNQNNTLFPASQNYYKNLFAGNLGFVKVKEFSRKTGFFLDPENGEETWTVFDNPTIRVFKKQK